jgi:hypothetical protein
VSQLLLQSLKKTMDETKKARMKLMPDVHILQECFLKTMEVKNGFNDRNA